MDNEQQTVQAPQRRVVDRLFGGDKVIWVVMVILLIISIYVAYSASFYQYASEQVTRELIKQIVFIVAGFGLMFGVQFVPTGLYRKRACDVAYWVSVLLTVAMFIFGERNYGAPRTLSLFGISFQPFELLKITVVWMLARALARRQRVIDSQVMVPGLVMWIRDPKLSKRIWIEHTIPLFWPVVLACCMTVWISNSTTVIIILSCVIMLFLGRMRIADIVKVVLVLAVVGGCAFVGIRAVKNHGRSETAISRVSGWQPDMIHRYTKVEEDGKEYYYSPDEALQAKYAKMSIASGGVLGRGPGMSTTRALLPKADKDMAYAYFVEEYGTWGAIVIVLLFMVLFFRSVKIFERCGTAFPGLMVLGLMMMIVLQALIHMMVSVSLLPVTGQQLPIISKGGTSLLIMLASVGMILGVSRQMQNNTLERPKEETMFEKN